MIKFTEEEKIRLKESNNQYLIGRLSLSRYREDYPPIVEKKQPVSKMRNSDSVAYFVELVSTEPEEYDDNFNEYFSSEFFVGIDACTHPRFLPPRYKNLPAYEREKRLYRHLSNKLIVFKPKINFKGEYAYKNLEIVALIDDDKIDKKNSFTPCPLCIDDASLSKGKEIFLPNNPHSEKFQSIIFSDHSIYLGRWIPVKNKEYYWKPEINKKRPIVKFGIDEILAYTFNTTKDDLEKFKVHKNIFVNINNHTCFFYTPLIKSIDEYITHRGGTCKNMAVFSVNKEGIFSLEEQCLVELPELNNDIKENVLAKEINVEETKLEEVKEEVKKEIETTSNITKQVKQLKSNIENNTSNEVKKKKDFRTEIKSETIYLNHLSNIIKSNNLLIDNNDILNIYTSLKTNNLTVLSGMTGIGKTKILKSFANSLGLNTKDNTLLIMPISPSYTEPSDILGFFNAATNKYIPSETNLIDILVHANNNKDKMHMVIFEEMNLSQVEHWFAPFMSLLELDPEERVLTLYNKNIECLNSNLYPSEITIGDNILFVGTINVDETTKEFSDRFLDRINLINISKKSFLGLKDLKQNKNKILDSYVSSYNFNKFKTKEENYTSIFTDKELVFFDQLHELLSSYNNTKGISYRTISKIAEYILNVPKNSMNKPVLNTNQVLDMQIKQRVLTKIKGSEKEYGELLGTCNSISGDIKDSKLYDFFNTSLASEISSFEECKKDIIRKSKELDLYGYTE